MIDPSQITTVQWFPGIGNGIVDVATVLIELIVVEDCFDAGNLFVLACCEPGILFCDFQVGVLKLCIFNYIETGYKTEPYQVILFKYYIGTKNFLLLQFVHLVKQ